MSGAGWPRLVERLAVAGPHSEQTHLLRFDGRRTVCELDARGWLRAPGDAVTCSACLEIHRTERYRNLAKLLELQDDVALGAMIRELVDANAQTSEMRQHVLRMAQDAGVEERDDWATTALELHGLFDALLAGGPDPAAEVIEPLAAIAAARLARGEGNAEQLEEVFVRLNRGESR